MSSKIGLVAIGRNEGLRLQECLRSLVSTGCPIVYIDSGSTDESVKNARAIGATVVSLDMSIPFSAARARNEGLAELKRIEPDIAFVQFLDGDCILRDGWLEKAKVFLVEKSDFAVACGRRRERYPERSIYNLLCDLEWDTSIGVARACGGDALMRISAFDQVGGFNPSVIAGEEPELCVRLRQAGWSIQRLDHEMTLHDAAIFHFSSWWKRNVRGGYASALGASMHGKKPERLGVKRVRSAIVWGGMLPLIAIGAGWPTRGWSLLILGLYPAQWIRIFLSQKRCGRTARQARLMATFLLVGKFAECQGVVKFYWHKLTRQKSRLIEYKSAPPQPLGS